MWLDFDPLHVYWPGLWLSQWIQNSTSYSYCSKFKACAKGMLGNGIILWKRVFFTFDSIFISFALHFLIYKKLASVTSLFISRILMLTVLIHCMFGVYYVQYLFLFQFLHIVHEWPCGRCFSYICMLYDHDIVMMNPSFCNVHPSA